MIIEEGRSIPAMENPRCRPGRAPSDSALQEEKSEKDEKNGKKQRFAWMDSGDEGSVGSEEEQEAGAKNVEAVRDRNSSESAERGGQLPISP